MRSIKKLKSTGKAVAGSALLVGATLTGAAGFAAAQDSGSDSMDLGDYPQPFVNDDGEVDSTIVVGSQGKVSDVVGAINIAGSLGNAAFSESEESVSVEGSFGWSATNGVTLDTRNDQLHLGDNIDTVRQTLTEDQLDVLQTHEVLSGDEEQDVEQYLYLQGQGVEFGTPGDTANEEDPFLYVNNPAEPSAVDGGLYKLQANFDEGVQFVDDSESDDRNEDVYGEELTMFGMDFTVADESFTGDGQLVLYGSQQEIDVSSGESSTFTVNEEEHTVETVAVTASDAAAVRVDGDLEQVQVNDEFDVDGETLRVDSIIDTGDNGAGVVQFAIGSEKITLEDQEPVMMGSDDDEVEGTYVKLSGNKLDHDVTQEGNDDVELSSIEIGVGASDSDDSYVRAGETFEDPVFNDVEFHFGGLNPDAASEDAEGVGTVEFGTDGDDTATVSWDDGDNSVTQPFVYDGDTGDALNPGQSDEGLMTEDGDIVVAEGEPVAEDDYVVTDAGDFSHMWEVTSIDRDETGDNIRADDEATIELEDVVTGASVEVNLDAAKESDNDFSSTNSDEYYAGSEVIDGQSYNFVLEGGHNSYDLGDTDETEFAVTWGSGTEEPAVGHDTAVGTDNTLELFQAVDRGSTTSLYAAQDTDSGSAVAFTKKIDGLGTGEVVSSSAEVQFELPSTDGTSTETVTIDTEDSNGVDHIRGADSETQISGTQFEFTAGQLVYRVTFSEDVNDDSGSPTLDRIALMSDQSDGADGDDDSDSELGPAAAVIQPEDESDNEEAYVVAPGTDHDGDNEVDVTQSGAATYAFTGMSYSGGSGASGYNTQTLDSDDNVQVSYSGYGTYTEEDTDDQGMFTLNIPDGQSSAGAAVTGAEGSLEASASGSGTVTTQTPTGWPDSAALDSEVSGSDRNQDLILVGGPAVNTLVEELASDNKTWTADDYEEDTWVLDLVEGFREDTHALVVAGYGSEDTTAAASYISNYADHQEELDGETRVSMTTSASTQ